MKKPCSRVPAARTGEPSPERPSRGRKSCQEINHAKKHPAGSQPRGREATSQKASHAKGHFGRKPATRRRGLGDTSPEKLPHQKVNNLQKVSHARGDFLPEALQDGRKNFRTSATRNGGHQTKDPEGQPRGMATTSEKNSHTTQKDSHTQPKFCKKRESPDSQPLKGKTPERQPHQRETMPADLALAPASRGGTRRKKPSSRQSATRREVIQEVSRASGGILARGSPIRQKNDTGAKAPNC